MESGKQKTEDATVGDEDTIYKSLTHPIRRNIIKSFAGAKSLTFSEMKKQVDPIDSPALAYHLKSLQVLIPQKDGKYLLSEVGKAALNLLLRVDQDSRIKKYQQKFWYAHVITYICWIVAGTLVSIAYHTQLGDWSFILILIVLYATAAVDETVIGILRKLY